MSLSKTEEQHSALVRDKKGRTYVELSTNSSWLTNIKNFRSFLPYFNARMLFFKVSSGPRAVGAVKITPLAGMKGSPDLVPAAGDLPTSSILQLWEVTYSQRKCRKERKCGLLTVWPHYTSMRREKRLSSCSTSKSDRVITSAILTREHNTCLMLWF